MKRILTAIITGAIILTPQTLLAAPVQPAMCAKYQAGCIITRIIEVNGVRVYKWIVCETGVSTLALENGSLYKPRKILQDPENPGKRWEPGNEVTVMKPDLCKTIAKKYGKTLVKTTKKKNSTGGYYYVCTFK